MVTSSERLLQALNEDPDSSAENLINNVRASIDRFVGDAPQFDDITILCLKYYGPR